MRPDKLLQIRLLVGEKNLNNHRAYFQSCQFSFWNKNSAGNPLNATEIVIHIGRGLKETRQEFKWPDEIYQVEVFKDKLDTVFEIGWEEALASVRKALGVADQRR